ncbi:translation initiation factor IF-2 [Fulvimarina pelagi HTCC2506]|uniref:Translation initiation factor IF-2 n=1 Tax=Fulvimarina pelagi HTCC2506 TaxID=314231 RepID=Q0G503_9HYPH|nr:hypothetical protein [Fulvimarina pelagi]EAU43261.1 translation initiation factor IF-2 [Fulvimarina pelagi HTCC2506]
MAKGIDSAIDSVSERVEGICEFLHELDSGKPVDEQALKTAVHDCANVSQSMKSLKRVAERLESQRKPSK